MPGGQAAVLHAYHLDLLCHTEAVSIETVGWIGRASWCCLAGQLLFLFGCLVLVSALLHALMLVVTANAEPGAARRDGLAI